MAGPDLSAVTALIDFSTVVEAVLFVTVALVYVYVAIKGAKMLLAAVRGGSAYDYYTYEDYARDNRAAGLAVMSREEYEEHPF